MGKAIVVIMLFCGCAAPFENWTKADTTRQAVLIGLTAVDWAQTRQIVDDPNHYESNPILGEYPTKTEIDVFMIAGASLQLLIPAMLQPKYRRIFQYIFIVERAVFTANNYRIGIRF